MKLTGTQIIPASRDRVWKGLNDPDILRQCIPGCSKIERLSPTDFRATVTVPLGPLKVNFSGQILLSNLNPPDSYRISGKGEGGFAGFAAGGADIRLSAISANETQMDYDADAQIGGKLAKFGSKLVGSTASSLTEKFFSKFANLINAEDIEPSAMNNLTPIQRSRL